MKQLDREDEAILFQLLEHCKDEQYGNFGKKCYEPLYKLLKILDVFLNPPLEVKNDEKN